MNVFTKICMPPRDVSRILALLGAVDSRVIFSVGAGRVAAARVLPGLLELSPGKDLAGGVRFVPFALRGLGLGVVLVLLSFGLTLALLPCLAWCGGIRGSDCPCIVIGVQKVYPSFCTPTYLRYCDASPFPLRGNTTQAQEVARRISGVVAGESTQKVNIPSTHHNPYLSQYII